MRDSGVCICHDDCEAHNAEKGSKGATLPYVALRWFYGSNCCSLSDDKSGVAIKSLDVGFSSSCARKRSSIPYLPFSKAPKAFAPVYADENQGVEALNLVLYIS